MQWYILIGRIIDTHTKKRVLFDTGSLSSYSTDSMRVIYDWI